MRKALIAVCGAGLVASVLTAPAEAQVAIEGEHGLYVTDTDGEVGVHWLSDGARPGAFQALVGDSVIVDVATPAAGTHEVRFPRPDRDVELRYGPDRDGRMHSTTLFLGEDAPLTSGELTGVDSLYVVGDVHGEYDRLRRLLHNAGLVDDDARWTGGRSHLVFLGDVFDRGDDVTRTLWLMYRLEREARAAGGGAHVVLGNHETMIFTDDIRYVSPKESLVARLHGVSYQKMFDIRESVLGRWLARRPGLLRVDGVLLAHGGVVPEVRPHAVAAVNDSLRAFMAEDIFYLWADSMVALATDSAVAEAAAERYDRVIVMDSAAVARRMALIFDERSILWYRGYVEADTLGAELDRALENFQAELHVVGHTPVEAVAARYEGKLLAVDLEEPASEMLLLTRRAGGGHDAWRLLLEGPAEPL